MKKLILILGLLMLVFEANAQDPQFSQFYANQVLLSPTFTGTTSGPRLALNARSQWVSIPSAYKTFAMSFDLPLQFGPTYHGAGLTFMADQAGAGNLQKLDVLLNYSYKFQINENHVMRFGLAAGFQQTSIDFYKLRFPNQFDPLLGYDPGKGNGEIPDDSRFTEEITAGVLYYNRYFWAGVNVNHLTTPQQELTTTNGNKEDAKLPMKISAFTGFNIPLNRYKSGSKQRTISPSIMYRHQGPFDQLDLGCYVNLDPIVLGVYFRAIEPDAVIGLVGIKKGMFRFGYSYDYTVSSLSNTISGGSHEVSLVIEFDELKKKPKRPSVNMSCPKF